MNKILFLIPILFFVICASSNNSFGIIQPFDYTIYQNGTIWNAQNGTTGNIDFSGFDCSIVLQQSFNSMKEGQNIFQKSGKCHLTSDLIVNKSGITWIGVNSGTVPTSITTKIFTDNHSVIFPKTNNAIDKIWFYGPINVNKDVVRFESGTGNSGFIIGDISITGSSTSNCLHFAGDGIHTLGYGWSINSISTTNCKVGIQFDNSTQGHIEDATLGAYFVNAIAGNYTDNITFGHVVVSTPQTGSSCGMALNTMARAWYFGYLSITVKAGQPSICDNWQITQGLPKDKIDYFEASNPIQTNNHTSIFYWDAISATWKTG